jgi:curved DNA-binding protein CbpA
MQYQFFTAGMDEKRIKERYRDLAKKHHPDLGGDTATMQAVNAEYERILKDAYRKTGMEEEKVNERWAMDEEVAAVAMKVFRLRKELVVELCGVWLWITGPTFFAKDDLKALGCRFSGQKKAWYYRREIDGAYKRHGKAIELEAIRRKYGSVVLAYEENTAYLT